MSETLTARHLFNSLSARLGLDWLSGEGGAERELSPLTSDQSSTTLVGHLNFIHPNKIQVLGRSEFSYLDSLGKNSYQDTVQRLFSTDTVMVVVAENQPAPKAFVDAANASDTPLMASALESDRLITNLQYFLGNMLAEKATLHGVFMEVMGIGVLLSGETSVGKSELAVELITRGHRLIADDAPEFARIAPDIINGSCPDVLREFLEVRGLGVINIRAMFGDSAIKQNKYLRLIIRLEHMSDEQLRNIDRLQGSRRTRKVLGVDIPEISLPVAPGRNLAVLVEIAVRNHLLSLKGYEAYREFMRRQQRLMEQDQT